MSTTSLTTSLSLSHQLAFTILKKEFVGWDFISKDIAYAIAHLHMPDPQTGHTPLFSLFGCIVLPDARGELTKMPALQALVSLGVNLNMRVEGGTALHYYVMNPQNVIVHCLLKAGADCNIQTTVEHSAGAGLTPAMLAMRGVEEEHQDIALTLLRHPMTNPFLTDMLGSSLVNYAQRYGYHVTALQARRYSQRIEMLSSK